MIDLHSHSLFSDGTWTPTEIIEQANSLSLSAIALTDHDGVSGLAEFQEAAKKHPHLLALNGSELGLDYQGDSMMPQSAQKPIVEIIAMNIQNLDPFAEWEKRIMHDREEANFKRVEKLRTLGFDITFEDVILDENGKKRNMVGKPHVAEAMLKKGYIKTIQEAFKKYLDRGLPAYVKQVNPTEIEVLDFIRQTGAVPILPHPRLTKVKGQDLYNLVKHLKSNGLMGIEVFHSVHEQEHVKQYFEIAKEFNLIISGGSDFHGQNKPDISLGIGKGNLNIPDILLEPILTYKQPKQISYKQIEKFVNALFDGKTHA